jgi:hypothetical protein
MAAANPSDFATRFHGSNHIYETWLKLPQTLERCGGAMRDDGLTSASEHGREHSTVPSERRIANSEGRSEDRVQPSRRYGVIDRRLAQADVPQLSARHDPMLALGQPPHIPPYPSLAVPLRRYPK